MSFQTTDTTAMTDQPHEHDWIQLKYHTISDATDVLGGVDEIRNLFIGFQKHLYEQSNRPSSSM